LSWSRIAARRWESGSVGALAIESHPSSGVLSAIEKTLDGIGEPSAMAGLDDPGVQALS
jgi:hypothetical protein